MQCGCVWRKHPVWVRGDPPSAVDQLSHEAYDDVRTVHVRFTVREVPRVNGQNH